MGCPVKIARFKARIERMKWEVAKERRARLAREKARVETPRTPYFLATPRTPGLFLVEPAPPPASGQGVYALRETGTNFVKIGWCGEFSRRYSSMRRTENPRRLIFLGWLSRLELEADFHRKYAAYSVGGQAGGIEWFDMPEEVIAQLVAGCVK